MLKQRVITALIMAPVVLGCVFYLPAAEFSLFVIAVLTIGGWEWANLAGLTGAGRWIYAACMAVLLGLSLWLPPLPVLMVSLVWWVVALFLVVTYPANQSMWSSRPVRALIGPVLLIPGLHGLMVLKGSHESSFLIIMLFFLIWGADIGAYFSGKAFGNKKLAPNVSPGKSWAGFYGGLMTALIIVVGMTLWIGKPVINTPEAMLFFVGCGLVVMISVLGDLTESMFKRFAGVKDSSQLLPGHGGVLDRIDSLLSAGPLFALLLLYLGRVQL